MLKYLRSIKEELKVSDIDEKTLDAMKKNLLFRLGEYRESILSNIEYNFITNKVEYKNFDTVDVKTMIRELNNELTEDFVKDLNVEAFLRKINQLMILTDIMLMMRLFKSFIKMYQMKF